MEVPQPKSQEGQEGREGREGRERRRSRRLGAKSTAAGPDPGGRLRRGGGGGREEWKLRRWSVVTETPPARAWEETEGVGSRSSLHGKSGRGWAAKRWGPRGAGPTPTCGSRAAAPERGLVHRRRLQASTSRRGCCSAAAAARSPAGPEPGFPPPTRAGWPVGRGSTGPPSRAPLRSGVRGGSGGSLTSLPGVLSASSFPRVRSAASAAAATASPTSPASRGAAAAAAAPRPLPLAILLPALLLLLTPPARLGLARSRGDSAGGRREASAAPSPQSTARLHRGGRPRPGPGGSACRLGRGPGLARAPPALPRSGEYPARLLGASSNL